MAVRPRAPALEVRDVGGELRAEHQHAVAGVEQRLGEILLERLGAGRHHHVPGRRADPELGGDEPRRGVAEFGQAEAGAVARPVRLDRPDAGGLGVRRARERAVADLELDDLLPLRLQGPGEDFLHCVLGRLVVLQQIAASPEDGGRVRSIELFQQTTRRVRRGNAVF